MSYCVSHGKDKVIFVTKEDHETPSTVVLPEDDEPSGFLLPNGEINWNCPCLGGMVVGPCSVEFRDSLTCFHQSTADPKGSDCLEQFRELNTCMAKYPTLYNRDEDDDVGDQLEQLDLDKDSNSQESNKVDNSSSTQQPVENTDLKQKN